MGSLSLGLNPGALFSRSLDLHSGVLDVLPLGVVVLDEESRVLLYNRAEERMSGRSRDKVLGKPFFECVAPCLGDTQAKELFVRARDRGEGSTMPCQFAFPHRDRVTHVILHWMPLNFGDRRVVGLFVEDTTEQETLRQEKELLLSAMFHDLRSPLAGISNYTEVLAEQVECDMVSEELRRVSGSAKELSMIVDQTTQQLSGDAEARSIEELDLCRLLHDLCHETRRMAGREGLELYFNGLMPDIHTRERLAPVLVRADRLETGRSLRNLLENARKYAIRSIHVELRDTEAGSLEIRIDDDGPGVPEGYEEKVFLPGVQAPDAERGTGLGLSGVRHWANSMGGDAWATRSDLGGARFVCRIRRAYLGSNP